MRYLFIALALVVAATSQAAAQQKNDAPAYFIGQINIADEKQYFEGYVPAAMKTLSAAGAEVLVATPRGDGLEGEWPGNWQVVIRFPSMKAARDWYASPEYQAARPLRLGSASFSNLVFVSGYLPPPPPKQAP